MIHRTRCAGSGSCIKPRGRVSALQCRTQLRFFAEAVWIELMASYVVSFMELSNMSQEFRQCCQPFRRMPYVENLHRTAGDLGRSSQSPVKHPNQDRTSSLASKFVQWYKSQDDLHFCEPCPHSDYHSYSRHKLNTPAADRLAPTELNKSLLLFPLTLSIASSMTTNPTVAAASFNPSFGAVAIAAAIA